MEEQHSPTDPLEPSTDTADQAETPPQDGPTPSAASERVPEEQANAAPATRPLTLEEILSAPETSARLSSHHPSPSQPWRTPTRRQVLTGMGILIGAAVVGTGTTLTLLAGSSSPGSSSSATSASLSPTGTTGTPGLPPAQAPGTEAQLQAWRTKQVTVKPSQRFKHHSGTALVPLGVVETSYPNKYNPYHIHLQGYILGGTLVANTQFFLYLGLDSIDGSQFVGKVRVGPIDQSANHFGILVTQQSTDDIEGGPAEFPQITLAPRAIYQALSALVDHCIEVAFIRLPLPSDQDEVPVGMLAEVNEQAMISDQFLRMDFEAIHQTPLPQLPASALDPIRHLVDDSPITYHSATDADRYPVVTQLILRHTDQLYPKLVSG